MKKTAGIYLTALFTALAIGPAALAQAPRHDDACFLTGSLGLDRNGSSTDTDQYGDYKGLSGVLRCGDNVFAAGSSLATPTMRVLPPDPRHPKATQLGGFDTGTAWASFGKSRVLFDDGNASTRIEWGIKAGLLNGPITPAWQRAVTWEHRTIEGAKKNARTSPPSTGAEPLLGATFRADHDVPVARLSGFDLHAAATGGASLGTDLTAAFGGGTISITSKDSQGCFMPLPGFPLPPNEGKKCVYFGGYGSAIGYDAETSKLGTARLRLAAVIGAEFPVTRSVSIGASLTAGQTPDIKSTRQYPVRHNPVAILEFQLTRRL